MPDQLGSDYLGRLITRNGGTVQRPCPTGGLLNDYCDSDDYYAWKESEAAQASEIARKEQEIKIRGLELGAVAVGAQTVYIATLDESDSWVAEQLSASASVLSALGSDVLEEAVNRVIRAMEAGAAYEMTLSEILEAAGVKPDKEITVTPDRGAGAGLWITLGVAAAGVAYLSGRLGRR